MFKTFLKDLLRLEFEALDTVAGLLPEEWRKTVRELGFEVLSAVHTATEEFLACHEAETGQQAKDAQAKPGDGGVKKVDIE